MTIKKISDFTEFSSKEQSTNSYKFKIEMIVSLFAENEAQASEILDAQGGHVIKRHVGLLETTEIHKSSDD